MTRDKKPGQQTHNKTPDPRLWLSNGKIEFPQDPPADVPGFHTLARQYGSKKKPRKLVALDNCRYDNSGPRV